MGVVNYGNLSRNLSLVKLVESFCLSEVQTAEHRFPRELHCCPGLLTLNGITQSSSYGDINTTFKFSMAAGVVFPLKGRDAITIRTVCGGRHAVLNVLQEKRVWKIDSKKVLRTSFLGSAHVDMHAYISV